MSQRKDDPVEMERMRKWLRVAAEDLGVAEDEYAPFEADLLALTRTLAHGPSRPAAPITTFLVGITAGRGESVEGNIERLTALAEAFDIEEIPS